MPFLCTNLTASSEVNKRVQQLHFEVLKCFITARIRRMGEGTVFSLFVSSHLGGGVPPPQVWLGGGTPSQVWTGGVPGVPPQPGLDGVPPWPDLGWGTPWPDLGWGTP